MGNELEEATQDEVREAIERTEVERAEPDEDGDDLLIGS